jgi:hypothetical protein
MGAVLVLARYADPTTVLVVFLGGSLLVGVRPALVLVARAEDQAAAWALGYRWPAQSGRSTE